MNSDRLTLILTEHQEREVELSHAQAQDIRHVSRDRLTVQLGDSAGRWQLKASSFVGTIVTPQVRILVRPKVAIANVFYLLEASGQPVALSDDLFVYEKEPDLIPAFATFFAKHLDTALSRGVPRNYVHQHEQLPAVRGRVDLVAQQRLAGLVLPVECEFDDYTADIQLNRLLRAAAVRLLHLPNVTAATRNRLRQHLGRFEEVGDLLPADLRTSTRFTRLIAHCKAAERLSRIVLAGTSILDAVGNVGAASFMIDMNSVFEEFVGSRLRRYLAGRLAVHEQFSAVLDVDGHVRMKPDLVFDASGGRHTYVADCKYKLSVDGFGRQADYYQLNAYANALKLPEGLLIYCQDDGQVVPREVQVRHGGPKLRTWSIHLGGGPSDIEAELRSLADDVASRTVVQNVGVAS